ncbi:MAG: NAD(P)-binding protein, partial [Solirubrobacterales bacterium]
MATPVRTRHLVIGSGAGGAVTAAHLSEAGEEVMVIEEGRRIERGEVEQFSLDQLRLQYRNRGTTAMFGNYLLNYAEGCCLGGSTEVN